MLPVVTFGLFWIYKMPMGDRMRRIGLLLLGLAAVFAQPRSASYDAWLERSRSQDLMGLYSSLIQPNAPAWPQLNTVPNPLANQIFERIKELEGAGLPALSGIGSRVEMYAAIAGRWRGAHGYANYVLADTLDVLSILHLGRWLTEDPNQAQRCSTLLESLNLPLLTPTVFQEIYRAKLGDSIRLEAANDEQMLASMTRLGDARDGFPALAADSLTSMNTGALLNRADPAAFLLRLSNTDLLGRGALAQLIEFIQKGGRLADVNAADVRAYQKLIPADYTPKPWGILTASVGVAQVYQLMEEIRDPDATTLLAALDGPRKSPQSQIRVTETVLGAVDGFRTGFTLGISPDQRQFHYVSKRSGKEILVTARGESHAYDRISKVLYNPQGTRYAFVANEGGRDLAILDGAAGRVYDQIDPRDLRFSPDGQHFAFRATRGAQQFIELDGREMGPSQQVLGLAFSSDQNLLYASMAREAGLWVVTCGGHQSAAYEHVNGSKGITFSPDGTTWTYQATLNGQRFNFVEGAQSGSYAGPDLRTPAQFSSGGERIMFPGISADGRGIEARIVDLRHPETQTGIEGDRVFFSPDLLHRAAAKRTAPGEYTVTVDAAQRRMKSVSPPIVYFSASGARYMIHANAAGSGEKTANLIIDGTAAPVEHRVESMAFSPDGRSWAYSASLVSGERVRNVIVRDGRQIHSYSSTGHETRLTFSPDSRHLAYTIAHGPGSWALAIDGEEAPNSYDFFPFEARVIFDSPSELHTIAVRNGQVLLVSVHL